MAKQVSEADKKAFEKFEPVIQKMLSGVKTLSRKKHANQDNPVAYIRDGERLFKKIDALMEKGQTANEIRQEVVRPTGRKGNSAMAKKITAELKVRIIESMTVKEFAVYAAMSQAEKDAFISRTMEADTLTDKIKKAEPSIAELAKVLGVPQGS